MAGVNPYIAQADYIDALTAMGAPLNAAYVSLVKSNLALLPTITIAAVTAAEASYTGYAHLAAGAWHAAGLDPDGIVRAQATSLVFTATGGDPGDTIFGYALTDMAKTKLLRYVALDAPVVMGVDPLRVLPLTPEFALQ